DHLNAVLLDQRDDVASETWTEWASGRLPGRVMPGGEAEAGIERKRATGEMQLWRVRPDRAVGIQHDDGRVPPREPVPPLVAERMERLELWFPAVRRDVVVAERREPGRLAHHCRVGSEDVAIEQLGRPKRVGVVAHGEHEVRVPRLDQRGDRQLVLRSAT